MLLMLLLARRVFYTRRKDEGRVNTLSDVSLFSCENKKPLLVSRGFDDCSCSAGLSI